MRVFFAKLIFNEVDFAQLILIGIDKWSDLFLYNFVLKAN